MSVKAVFFDIDGTLLTDMKTISKSTRKAIKELQKQEILVGVATGRGPSFVQPFMENLGLDFAVTYNGQYIFSRDKVFYQNHLPKAVIYRLIKYANQKRKEISLGTASGLVGSTIIRFGTGRLGQVVSRIIPKQIAKIMTHHFRRALRTLKPQNSASLIDIMREPIFQVVLVASYSDISKLQEAFPELSITRSSPYSADIISKNQSKLLGIKRLGEIFSFTLDDVMAFGDSHNDLDMLAGVGIGVAMGNAEDSVKERSHFVTTTNNNDGIALALAHFGLIESSVEEHFSSLDTQFNQVKTFHHLMDGQTQEMPTAYNSEQAIYRASFKIEELVEFLHASTSDEESFQKALEQLHEAITKASLKVSQKASPEYSLVGQADALVDLLYFTYGSFVLMGIDPQPLFNSVHAANMGKIFPDGKAHFDPITHKILKPDHWEERFAPEPAIRRELNRQIQKAKRKLAH